MTTAPAPVIGPPTLRLPDRTSNIPVFVMLKDDEIVETPLLSIKPAFDSVLLVPVNVLVPFRDQSAPASLVKVASYPVTLPTMCPKLSIAAVPLDVVIALTATSVVVVTVPLLTMLTLPPS